MTDGTGTTPYTYVPIGSLGALQLQQESSPLANSAIAYAYDELGRLASRTVSGAGAETFHYDPIGRLTTHASDLGAFTLGYLGQTGQLTSRTLASSTLATNWSYLPNSGDRRLSGINNTGLTAGQFSNYTYTTTPENQITGIAESSDASAVYPVAGTQTATYNNLNQLTSLSGQALTFDANGNLTSDGQRNYTWDAENRLLGITYPGASGKATAFTYDGLGRRVSIASTPAGGGSATTTSYLWCGSDICQARNASNTTTRSYYDEGEYVPGSPAQPYYYGIDQIGSVRRAFASTSSALAYGYDPYGVPLQTTAPVTDYVYGGMFYNADSGLYLTRYRAYDSVVGRWLSRDPLGEATTSPVGNLYTYVGGRPTNATDISGLVASGPVQAGPSSGGQSCSDGGFSARPQLAQLLGPPPVFFGRPPVVLPRPVTPLEELPPGSSGGLGAERNFPRSYNKQQPEGTPCLYCGEPTTKEPGPNQLQGDHVVPKSQGGNNTPENYAPSCRTCNLQKGPRTPKEWYNKLGPGGEG